MESSASHQSASNPLDRLIDWFIPAEMAAQRDERQRARMFLISHICGPFIGNVVPGTLLFIDPTPGWPVAILAASITAFWVMPFLLRAIGHYSLLTFISVQNLHFCIFWSCYFYGGVTSPTLPWVLSIPLLAFFYLGGVQKQRALLLGQIAVNFAAFFAVYHLVPPPFDDTPLLALQGFGIVSTLSAAGYFAMMALYYARILASGVELEGEVREHLTTATELRRATAKAEQAGAAKAEFVASMSHELRTPLNAVIGYSQMLLEEASDEDDEQSAADLEKIHSAGQHLLRLVNEVLDLSKIEAGKMDVAAAEIDVGGLLTEIAGQRIQAAEAKGLRLTVEPTPDVGRAHWDAQKAAQAIGQVLDNAVKFTERGSVTVSAQRVHGGRGREEIHVHVSDTGIGIDPGLMPSLFEKFTVAHDASASKYGDTGLGLALSLALCRLMGGDITATSEPGRGSCFTVILPVMPVSRARKKNKPAEDTLAAAA